MPVLDKAMLLNVSNLWPLELEFQSGKIDDMAVFLSDLLLKTYGFGFKIYNPFENETWNLKELREWAYSMSVGNLNPKDVEDYMAIASAVARMESRHNVNKAEACSKDNEPLFNEYSPNGDE